MRRLCLSSLLAASSCAGLLAQGGALPRQDALGRVLDAQARPRASAIVELVSLPLPGDDRFGRIDRVLARSDERGRVRAAVLPGRSYAAWAHSPAADGRDHVTPIRDGIVAGLPFELSESTTTRARLQLDVTAIAATRGPLNVVLVPVAEQRPLPWSNLVLEALDGRVRGPALPDGTWLLRIVERSSGTLLRTVPLELAAEGRLTLDGLGPLLEHSLAVRDAETGALLGDARCESLAWGLPFPGAALDADGQKLWRGTAAETPALVRAPSHAPRLVAASGGARTEHRADWPALRAGFAPRAQAWLPKARRVRGRITLHGQAAAGLELVVQEAVPGMDGAAEWLAVRRALRCDAEGRFTIADLERTHVMIAHALLDEALLARLPFGEEGLDPLVHSLLVVPPGDALDVELAPIALESLDAVRITALLQDGTPAAGAELWIDPGAELRRLVGTLRTHCDRLGRHRRLVPPARRLDLVVRTPQAIDAFVLSSSAQASGARTDHSAALRSQARLTGRVVDGNGEPRGDVRVEVTYTLRHWPQRPGVTMPGDDLPARGSALVHEPARTPSFLLHVLALQAPRSDAAGNFAITVPRATPQILVECEGRHCPVDLTSADDPPPISIGTSR